MSTKVKDINRQIIRKMSVLLMVLGMCVTLAMSVDAQEKSASFKHINILKYVKEKDREYVEDNDRGGEEDADISETPSKTGYVVVLDPGHDSSHTGAAKNGLYEERLNMKIAQYCKEALEEYSYVTVYLTHEDLSCPYPGTDSKECNKKRCEFAASVDADLFVSLHINNNDNRYTRGYELYYPTTNYISYLNPLGYDLVRSIEKELIGLGMSDHGIYTRNSTENKKNDENFYPDGTRADYYNVIRNCKYHEILGVIVEHGYLSNKSDVNQFLNSDAKLQALGEADARGIAEYLGLHIKTEEEIAAEIEAELAAEKAKTDNEKINDKTDNVDIDEIINPSVISLARIDFMKKSTTDAGEEGKIKVRRLEDVLRK
ncbi:MAG: N-acetylmuramoyl-L-alanine amidase [Lachnospiraceae bacterium]